MKTIPFSPGKLRGSSILRSPGETGWAQVLGFCSAGYNEICSKCIDLLSFLLRHFSHEKLSFSTFCPSNKIKRNRISVLEQHFKLWENTTFPIPHSCIQLFNGHKKFIKKVADTAVGTSDAFMNKTEPRSPKFSLSGKTIVGTGSK